MKQSCFRAVQDCFPLIQRCSALHEIRHILVWNSEKKTLYNTTFHLHRSTFYSKPNISAFLLLYRSRAIKKQEGEGGCANSKFWLNFPPKDFCRAGTLQKNIFFVITIPSQNYRKHFRWFPNSFWCSAEQRWFRENQRWRDLNQRWLGLKLTKSLKQRCSELICSGTSIRVPFKYFFVTNSF